MNDKAKTTERDHIQAIVKAHADLRSERQEVKRLTRIQRQAIRSAEKGLAADMENQWLRGRRREEASAPTSGGIESVAENLRRKEEASAPTSPMKEVAEGLRRKAEAERARLEEARAEASPTRILELIEKAKEVVLEAMRGPYDSKATTGQLHRAQSILEGAKKEVRKHMSPVETGSKPEDAPAGGNAVRESKGRVTPVTSVDYRIGDRLFHVEISAECQSDRDDLGSLLAQSYVAEVERTVKDCLERIDQRYSLIRLRDGDESPEGGS